MFLPRHHRQLRRLARLALAAALALILTASLTAPVQAKDKLRDKHNRVTRSIKATQNHLEESSKAAGRAYARLQAAATSLKAAQADLRASRTAVSVAQVRDARLAVQLVKARNALATAREDLAVGQAQVEVQERAIGELIASQAQSASPGLLRLTVLFTTTSPADAAVSMQATDNLADRQAKVLDDLRLAKEALAATETRVQQARDDVAARKREAAANLRAKKAAEEAARLAQQRVTSLVSQRRAAHAEALQAKRADERELRKLRKENLRIQRLLRARAAHHGGGYTGSENGFLLRPVPGYVTSPFGYRRHPIYGYWGLHDGVDFHAPCGTPLRASADGTVISKYFQTAWGNRLILDLGNVNGKGVAVIYNHLSSYNVGTGDRVKRGDVVGYAGTTGWSTACHLHFTVMVNGSPVDPMPWF